MVAATIAAACLAGAYLCLWQVLPIVVHLLRPLLVRLAPDDLCGPDGWLIDTRTRRGIFDYPGPRRGA